MAVRAVSGMVESGFSVHHLYWNHDFRRLSLVHLPADGPLTEEKGTAAMIAARAYNTAYWFPFRDTEAEGWQPALTLGDRQITLDIFFDSQIACESFITNYVFRASGELGFARVKSRAWDYYY